MYYKIYKWNIKCKKDQVNSMSDNTHHNLKEYEEFMFRFLTLRSDNVALEKLPMEQMSTSICYILLYGCKVDQLPL